MSMRGQAPYQRHIEHGEVEPREVCFSQPEFKTAAPQPLYRVTALTPGSPEQTSFSDEADQELQSVMMGCGEKGSFTAIAGRPLSSLSTSAGATPSPDSRPGTVPPTPQLDRSKKELCDTFPEKEMRNASGANNKAPPFKVFVGGVPQDLDADDISKVLSNFAGAPVKKAWMQKHKVSPEGGSNNTQKHRGFGFVIFHDATVVDRLLGDQFSRFLTLQDGRPIEVKRAVSSTDMRTDVGKGNRQVQPPGNKGRSSPPPNAGQQKGQLAPPMQLQAHPNPALGMWPADPRQLMQQGSLGFATPDHTTRGVVVATPPRGMPLQQSPVSPAPSSWTQSPPHPQQAVMANGPLPAGWQHVQVAQPWNGAVCGLPYGMELVPGPGSSGTYAIATNLQGNVHGNAPQSGSMSVPLPPGYPGGFSLQAVLPQQQQQHPQMIQAPQHLLQNQVPQHLLQAQQNQQPLYR